MVTKYLLGAIFLFGFIAPYSHIVYSGSDTPGIFGFPKMVSFLFSIGFPIFCTILAYLLRFASNYLPFDYKKLFRIFAFLTAFTGFYFTIWAINPYVVKDFHPLFYYSAMAFISGILSYSMKYYKSPNILHLKNQISHLKLQIVYVMNLMAKQAVDKGHIKDESKYEEDIVYPALKKLDE